LKEELEDLEQNNILDVEHKLPAIGMSRKILTSLNAGVVPKDGLNHLMIGRTEEVRAILEDIVSIRRGDASFKVVVGNYGAGKSFLLNAVRNHLLTNYNDFVVISADLSPNRRFIGSHGEGANTYRELIKNMSTKKRKNGGALEYVIQRYIESKIKEEHESLSDLDIKAKTKKLISSSLSELASNYNNGYEFKTVIELYYEAYITENQTLKDNVIKWLRCEYETKTAAKQDLPGIGRIITDKDWYDYIRIIAGFVKEAGYQGLLLIFDEIKQLSEISIEKSRQSNYEIILTMYNDILQGQTKHLGILMGATPEAMQNEKRGLYSYEALKSRLYRGNFVQEGMVDLLSPVIYLKPFEKDEVVVLLEKIYYMHAQVYKYDTTNNFTNQIRLFLDHEYSRSYALKKITPREIITDFINILNLSAQNNFTTIEDILDNIEKGNTNFEYSKTQDDERISNEIDEEYEKFEL